MDQAQSTIARTTPLTASFALAAYLALTIQAYIGGSSIFNKNPRLRLAVNH